MTAAEFERLEQLSAELVNMWETLTEYEKQKQHSYWTHRQVKELLTRVFMKTGKMHEIIDSVPSERTRKILRYRYVHILTWEQIADRMGYRDTRAPRRRLKRFLRGVKNGKYDPVQNGENSVK